MKNYLLSTGAITTRVDKYVMDLIKMNLLIYPGDIPRDSIGFDFIITDTLEKDLPSEIRTRASNLISNISRNFSSGVNISLDSVEIINSEKVKLTISVNQYTDVVEINLQKNS